MKNREQLRAEIQAEINAGRIIKAPKQKINWLDRMVIDWAKSAHKRSDTPFRNVRIR